MAVPRWLSLDGSTIFESTRKVTANAHNENKQTRMSTRGSAECSTCNASGKRATGASMIKRGKGKRGYTQGGGKEGREEG